MLFRSDQEAINSFKDQAIAEKYYPKLLESPEFVGDYQKLWKNVPEQFKNLPQLNQYKALAEFESYSFIEIEPPTSEENAELTYEKAAIEILAGDQQLYSRRSFSRNHARKIITLPDFCLYFIRNFNRFTNGIFKNIGYKFIEFGEDDDGDEVKIETEDRNEQRKSFLNSLINSLSTEIISQPEILQAIKESFIPSEVDKILSNYITVPQVQDRKSTRLNSSH